jgi:hypothetical protein
MKNNNYNVTVLFTGLGETREFARVFPKKDLVPAQNDYVLDVIHHVCRLTQTKKHNWDLIKRVEAHDGTTYGFHYKPDVKEDDKEQTDAN